MKRTYIIAEANLNTTGKVSTVLKMVDAAADAGANCIKFQAFQKGFDRGKFDKWVFNEDTWAEIMTHCFETKIDFLCTAFDNASVLMLRKLGQNRWKVPSGEMSNWDYLDLIASFQEPIYLSTGMASIEEVRASVLFLWKRNARRVTLMQCTTGYPTPLIMSNLRVLETYKRVFKQPVGLSDHTSPMFPEVACAAVALGAEVIEKHYTLDREMEGPDQHMSIEPHELANLVTKIRNVEQALGDGQKRIMPCEEEFLDARNRAK